MLITMKSRMSGKTHTLDIPVSEEAYDQWKTSGDLVQDAFPNLERSLREFLLTGITPDEWNQMFGTGSNCEEEEED